MDDQEFIDRLSIKLEEACLDGDYSLAKSLLKLGADPNSNQLEQEKSTPLWNVLTKGARGYQGMVSALIGSGAVVTQKHVDCTVYARGYDDLRLGLQVKGVGK